MITPATGLIITGAALAFLLIFLLVAALLPRGGEEPDKATIEYCGFLMATKHAHCFCGRHR